MKSVPKYHELMWPTLKALKALGGSATNLELLDKIIELESIPGEIQDVLHTDGRRTRLSYNLAWALTHLGKGGAVENSARAVWSITDKGERLKEADIISLRDEVRRYYQELRKKRKEEEAELVESEEETIRDWKDALLDIIQNISPDAFERLAQRILRESGFIKVEVRGKSGDGGIDGVGALRVNSLLSFQVYFQCKRYRGSVSSGDVRDFLGAMVGRSDKGLFLTTGTFTSSAIQEANREGVPAIDLIDGDQLCDILKNLRLGVRTEMVEDVEVDEEWFKKI